MYSVLYQSTNYCKSSETFPLNRLEEMDSTVSAREKVLVSLDVLHGPFSIAPFFLEEYLYIFMMQRFFCGCGDVKFEGHTMMRKIHL